MKIYNLYLANNQVFIYLIFGIDPNIYISRQKKIPPEWRDFPNSNVIEPYKGPASQKN